MRRTIAAYCQTVDDGRWDEFASLWAPDAVYRVMGRDIAGRDAIRAFLEKAQPPEKRGRHLAVNSVIEVDGPDAARACTDFVFLANTPDGPRPSATGRYLDELVPLDGRWVFAHREVVLR